MCAVLRIRVSILCTGECASLMRQYKTGNQYISEKQVLKIEAALHKIAHEIADIKLV
jgi:hypothetical protein